VTGGLFVLGRAAFAVARLEETLAACPELRLARLDLMKLAHRLHPEVHQISKWQWLDLVPPDRVPPALAAAIAEATGPVQAEPGPRRRAPAAERKVECEECGQPFVARRADARFCPEGDCRQRAHRARSRAQAVTARASQMKPSATTGPDPFICDRFDASDQELSAALSVTRSLCKGPGCGREFVPGRADARYCSPACRQRAHRRRVELRRRGEELP
jgi:hypothetical protein